MEALLELPYLSDTTGSFVTPEGESVTKTWKYYPGPHRDFIGLDRYYREAGVLKISRIGNAQVRLIKAKDLFDIGLAIGKDDPAFVLCDNPACADCVRQRAAIFADRMAKESFKLTASSRLAGRYVPEMVENLQSIGIKAVELDYVQGKACAFMKEEKLTAIVSQLRAEGIEISALSAEVVPDDAGKLSALAVAAGIKRLILPVGAEAAAKSALENGLEVLFRNINHTAVAASAAVNALSGSKACFNPAAFAKAGENPFLYSYRVGRYIKITGQLDVNDGLWDGRATVLAQGNGEVKELMSILRCHNFAGYFALGCGSIYPGSLKEAAAAMVDLLDNM